VIRNERPAAQGTSCGPKASDEMPVSRIVEPPNSAPAYTTQDQPIRAEIIGSDQCMAKDYTVRAAAPVLTICRKLVEVGVDPGRPLDAYRGEVLCIRVRAIGEAAGLEPSPRGVGFVGRPDVRGASPVRRNQTAAISSPGAAL
jgi:hypothetical protein